jgi:hypothetical protein
VKVVAAAILETMEIDPLLASEMIYRSAGAVWDEIGKSIVSFVEKWHAPGKVDRAVYFMIGSGRSEFASEVWRLVSDADTQVHLAALRAGRRFRPSVFGPDAEARIAVLPEEVRKHVLSEIAGQSGMDGIELATKLACADSNTAVKVAVIESLQFRRADRFVTQILSTAPDEVWQQLASRGYADEVTDRDAADRLRKEQQRAFELETNLLRKVQMLTHSDGASVADAGREIGSLIDAAEFPVREQNAGWGIQEAFKRFPDETSSALIHRLEAGLELAIRSEDLLKTKGISIDDGPLTATVMNAPEHDRIATAAACVIGPKTISRLIDRLVEIDEEVRAAGKWDEALGREHHTLLGRVSSTGLNAFSDALLSRSETKDPRKIGLLADVFTRHSKGDSENALRLVGEHYSQMVTIVAQWGAALLASEESTRSQLANVARAIEQLAAPSLVPTLRRLLSEDLARRKRAREEFLAAHNGVRGIDNDSHMSWTLQYRRAFIAIGGDEVERLMREYLHDAGYCGFGVDAAWALKGIWDREQNSPRDKTLFARSDFIDVKARRMARERATGGDSSPYAESILSVVSDLIKSGSDQDAHRHALALAGVAFMMPYGDKQALIDSLLKLPEPLQAKQHLLKVLAVAGEFVSAELLKAGVNELLEEAKTKSWLLDENSGRLDGWLELFPFSDRPKATFEVIVSLDPRLREPWRLRRVLSALAHAPSLEAEEVLAQLARHDARFFEEYEWLNALDNRETASAGQLLFRLICDGALSASRPTDTWSLSKKLASSIQSHVDLRKEVYDQYPALPTGPGKAVVAQAISEAPDIEGIMLLVKDSAAQNHPFRQTVLYQALQHALTGQRPSSQWRGMQEVFGIPSPELRQKLFAFVLDGGVLSELAVACLNAIEEIREHYGGAESEPRHPDITAGRPWPIITNWRKSE